MANDAEDNEDLDGIFMKENKNNMNEDLNFKMNVVDQTNQTNHKKDKKDNYFENLVKETKQNDFLYCPYLDQFDKIWVQNNCKTSKDKNILSCCGCFTSVCYSQEKLKYFTNMYISKEMKNIFLDYFEIFDYDRVLEIFKENINNFTSSDEELNKIGINRSNKNHFVGVKCEVCYNLLAIYDSDQKLFYVFNSI